MSSKRNGAPEAGAVAWWVAGFAAPIAILCAVAWASGVYPFGAESLLTEDLKYQYIDFFTWFRSVLLGQANVFYSFAQALGSNEWGLYSYYLASPLNVLVVLFDEDRLVDFVFLVTALKLGFIQLSMMLYLRKRFGLALGWCFALGIAFTWSLWVATDIRNPNWLDALVALPILALGCYRLANDGTMRLLVGASALAIITCWYMGYMLVLFSALCLAFETAARPSGSGAPRIRGIAMIGRYVASLALALLLSAFTFAPTVMAMLGSSASGASSDKIASRIAPLAERFPTAALVGAGVVAAVLVLALVMFFASRKFSVRVKAIVAVALVVGIDVTVSFAPFDALARCPMHVALVKSFAGSYVENAFPQIMTGSLCLVLAVSFLLDSKTSGKVRLAGAALLAVMLMSNCLLPLEFVWSGFRAPNGFYCRTGFLTAFVFVMLAAHGLMGVLRASVRPSRVVAAGAAVCAALLAGMSGETLVALEIAVIAAVTAGLALAAAGRGPKAAAVSLVVAATIAEVAAGGCVAWAPLYQGYEQAGHDAYVQESRAEWDALRAYDDSVYRVDKTYTRAGDAALNEGLAIGFDQLSSYSSAYNASVIRLLSELGYSKPGEFLVRYGAPLLPSDSLLGVKYAFAEDAPYGYEPVELSAGGAAFTVYENVRALPIGYGIEAAAHDLALGEGDPFGLQNDLVGLLSGRAAPCYVHLDARVVSDEGASTVWEVSVPEGRQAYAYVQAATDDAVSVSVEGFAPFEENTRFCQSIFPVGDAGVRGRTVRVTLSSASGVSAESGRFSDVAKLMCAALDVQALDDALEVLGQRPLSVEVFADGRIEGAYSSDDESYLLFSVPYDAGWSCSIDGEPVEAAPVADGALMALPMPAGESRVVLTYVPPGLRAGCAVTAATVVALLAFFLARRRMQPSRRA